MVYDESKLQQTLKNYENVTIGLLAENNRFSEATRNIFKVHIKDSVKQLKEILTIVGQLEAGEVHTKTNINEIRGATLSMLSDPENYYNNTIRLLSENRQHSKEAKDRLKEFLSENAKVKCFMNEIFVHELAISTDPE
ncbi:17381_t:CDS:1, partial [Dentiscutata heterogama]